MQLACRIVCAKLHEPLLGGPLEPVEIGVCRKRLRHGTPSFFAPGDRSSRARKKEMSTSCWRWVQPFTRSVGRLLDHVEVTRRARAKSIRWTRSFACWRERLDVCLELPASLRPYCSVGYVPRTQSGDGPMRPCSQKTPENSATASATCQTWNSASSKRVRPVRMAANGRREVCVSNSSQSAPNIRRRL